jgi:type IV pilus assembly protein PilO
MKEMLPIGLIQEKINALTSVQRLLMVVATLVIFTAPFYFLQYKPASERIVKLKRDVTAARGKLASLKKAAADVEVLQKQLAESEEAFSHMLTLLPDQKEIPGLLENVSLLGAEVGLENILFQPQPEQPHEFYASIPVQLDLIGSYNELGTFFDRISKLDRILKVESLSLIRRKESSLLQVGCTIVTYRFVEKPPEPPATQKAGEKSAAPAGGKKKK